MLSHPDSEPTDSLPTKTQFFSDLAQSVPLTAWRMHKESGHFDTPRMHHYRAELEQRYEADKPANPGRQGVLEHVLVVAARVHELGVIVDLSADMKKKLQTAAILHDAGKYEERLLMQHAKSESTSEWDAYDQAGARTWTNINNEGFDSDIVHISMAAGHTSIPEARYILSKENLSEADIAWLALHYVDDITRGSAPIDPAFINAETGYLENDLDKRMNMNRANSAYQNLNNEGVSRDGFNMPTFDAQQEVGHAVERRLFNMIGIERLRAIVATILHSDESLEEMMQPVRLPEIIDRLVHSRFNGVDQR